MTPLYGLKIVSYLYMTRMVPAPNRPRIKKANKRKTRLYWKKQPKYVTVPDPNLVRVGNCLYGHPATLAKVTREIERRNQ